MCSGRHQINARGVQEIESSEADYGRHMSDNDTGGHGYDATGVMQLEEIWGDGFMSPGGSVEVGRIVAGARIRDADVLGIGCGTGGAALVLAIEHGARTVTGLDVEPGPLPLPDGSVDVVSSKDAIVHVWDKHGLFADG